MQTSPLRGLTARNLNESRPAWLASLRSTSNEPLRPAVSLLPRASIRPSCRSLQRQV